MIDSINSTAQSIEARSSTIAPVKPSPPNEEAKVYNLKQVEKERPEKIQEKIEEKPQEDRKIKEEKVSQRMLDELAKDIEILHSVGLSFAQHKDSGRTMVSVMNRDTDEVIREIPSEEILDMAVKMEEMVGLLFDEKV